MAPTRPGKNRQAGAKIATTTTLAVDAIYTSLLSEAAAAAAVRPRLSRSKAVEIERLFLPAAAAGYGSRAEPLLLFVVRLLVAAATASVPSVNAARDLVLVVLPSSSLSVSQRLGDDCCCNSAPIGSAPVAPPPEKFFGLATLSARAAWISGWQDIGTSRVLKRGGALTKKCLRASDNKS